MISSAFLLVVVIEQMRICALQLNKVLMPNPFDRPNAVFSLEVTGPEGKWTQVLLNTQNFFFFFLFSFFLSSLFFPFFNTWQNILYTDSELVVNLDNSPINALKSKLMVGETKADVQLDGNWHFFFVDKRFWLFQSMRTFLAYYCKCRWSNSNLFGQSSNLWVW